MHNIAIIVITYNPNIHEFEENIDTYKAQSDFIVIVDNSDSCEVRELIVTGFAKYTNINVVSLGGNYGIAYAQNIGLKLAIDNGYSFFIEMDQDSKLPNNYVNNIYNTYCKLQNEGFNIAGIGPVAFNKKDNSEYHLRNTNSHLVEVEKTLSSGFFSSLEAINKIGYKNELLFIDLVDWEWCWRARRLGFEIFVDTNLRLPHMLGNGHKNFIFFKIGIPSPIRHYYQYRNALLLNKSIYVPFIWKIKRMLILVFKLPLYLFFFNSRAERFKYIFKGIRDGILGKTGKIS